MSYISAQDYSHEKLVSPRHAMTWTRYEAEQLRTREHEIEYLRQEEEQQRLREVPLDSDHGKRHTRDIAECVTGKGTGRIPEGWIRLSTNHPSYLLTSCDT